MDTMDTGHHTDIIPTIIQLHTTDTGHHMMTANTETQHTTQDHPVQQ